MARYSRFLIAAAFTAASLSQLAAHSYGPAPHVVGAPGDEPKACTLCHSGTLNSGTGSVTILLAGGAVYTPGVKQRIAVHVADPNQQRWGFELTARLNSDLEKGQAGEFTPIDNLTQVICEDAGPKPCSTGLSFIEHTSAGTRNGTKGGATFLFDWTPPATNVGPITFYAAGNAANGNGASSGDLIYTTNVQLSPALPAAPTVAAANIVSSATSAAGPLAPNSWVTVYGSHLGVTTRSWTDVDFTNGAMPTSLDGVSVVLNFFGAPRLAYVGYVSPNQINFLLPSDVAAGTIQVQVRNPAGITIAAPITVQANAPQLLTGDGKYALGVHANGAGVGKGATPAAPGETVTLYGTGLGATSPALIPGQVPAVAASLVTLPQVSIGGAPATVVSGSVLPGAGGVYQLAVTVPASTANGDQPVLVQIGTTTSAPLLLTVQK